MRLVAKIQLGLLVAVPFVLLATPRQGYAVACTTQAVLSAQDRSALATAGERLAQAVAQQDYAALRAALLPSLAADWDQMRLNVEQAAPLFKGGQVQLRNAYLLDATSLTTASDAQFFCSNATGSLTVTINLRALPPGRYAVLLADATGAPLAGQIGLVLAEQAADGWKLGGLSLRPGQLEAHDGLWHWRKARALLAQPDAKGSEDWSAWFHFELARLLLVPVDFLSSPNLEKLSGEEAQIKNSPANAFPFQLTDGARNWKLDSLSLDTSLFQTDLAVGYESTGVTDPAAIRTEAVAVMSALLKAKPGLRDNFFGLWAYSVKNDKRTPVLELPMPQIP